MCFLRWTTYRVLPKIDVAGAEWFPSAGINTLDRSSLHDDLYMARTKRQLNSLQIHPRLRMSLHFYSVIYPKLPVLIYVCHLY